MRTLTTLTRTTRSDFVAQFPGFAGMSTRAIREHLAANVTPEGLAMAGWRLPTGEAKAKRAEAIAWAELTSL